MVACGTNDSAGPPLSATPQSRDQESSSFDDAPSPSTSVPDTPTEPASSSTSTIPSTSVASSEPTTAADLLSGCAVPRDEGFFTPVVYPDSSEPLSPAADPGWTVEDRRGAISGLVEERTNGTSTAPEAQEVFTRAIERMDIRLAAGLALLVGRVPAAHFDIINTTFASVEFAPASTFADPTQIAGSFTRDATGELLILVNERYEHEDPAWFSAAVFTHEPLHHDTALTGRQEEAAARVFELVVTLDLLSDYPEMVDPRTELVRGQLTQLLGVIYNSNTMLEGRCANILPGGAVTVSDMYTQGPIQSETVVETPIGPSIPLLLQHWDQASGDLATHSEELLERLDIDEVLDSPAEPGVPDLVRVAELISLDLAP